MAEKRHRRAHAMELQALNGLSLPLTVERRQGMMIDAGPLQAAIEQQPAPAIRQAVVEQTMQLVERIARCRDDARISHELKRRD